MAQYYRVKPKYWKGDRRQWTDQEKLLGLYLMTCDHRNLEGLYWLPKAYIANDLGWSTKAVERALATLITSNFCKYDETAEVVLVVKALEHQAPSTTNQIKGAVASLDAVPSTSLWDEFMVTCRVAAPRLAALLEDGTGIASACDADAMPDATGDTSESDSDIARTHSSNSNSDSSSNSNSEARKRVFDEWVTVTGRTDRTVLDAKRRKLIDKALDAYPVQDVLDAVKGWRHSPHHCGQNDTGTVYNDLGLLLRDPGNIERFRDLERRPPTPIRQHSPGGWTAADMLRIGKESA